jgi:transcriptional activator SPT8
VIMTDAAEGLQPVQAPLDSVTGQEMVKDGPLPNGVENEPAPPVMNGLPHADDLETPLQDRNRSATPESVPTSDSTFLATSIDGAIRVWDRRQRNPTARILPRNTPPWCMSACWSPDGNYIYAGRRNCTVEEFDLRKGLRSPERTFKFPQGSGAVTSVKAMPNGRHLICASHDILRLYDLKDSQSARSTVPFLIVPGHRTGVISQLYFDPACRFMISTGGNRGWEGASTEVLLGYEIGVGN